MNQLEKNKTICLFGTYESKFARTITLKDAIIKNGYRYVECHIPYWELNREKQFLFSAKSSLKFIFDLLLIYLNLAKKYIRTSKHNAMIVGYNGYFDMPLAKILSILHNKPLIYTPVFPLYETVVEDRKYVSERSIKSKIIHKLDEIACRLADLIIIETDEYIQYYHDEFKIPLGKFNKIPLSADENVFYPRPELPQKPEVTILFYGKFIPLQGIQYIVKAAKLLENNRDIKFIIIGSGQLTDEINELSQKLNVSNIHFIEWIDYKELPRLIQEADICLGIFGDTPKSNRGIPIKVYEALAMKKPVITGRSPAAESVFTDGSNAFLCQMADAHSLSEAIMQLADDKHLRDKIAHGGYQLYHDLFSAKQITTLLKAALIKVERTRQNR